MSIVGLRVARSGRATLRIDVPGVVLEQERHRSVFSRLTELVSGCYCALERGTLTAAVTMDPTPRKSSLLAYLVLALIFIAATPGWLYLSRGPATTDGQKLFRIALLATGLAGLGVVALVQHLGQRAKQSPPPH